MTTAATPPASDDLVRNLIDRVSRFFDNEAGCEEVYFESALYPVWESLHVYVVGDIVTPTTPNAHKYRVTTAGTSGATEPVFPAGSGATVTNGSVVFTEYGADVIATARTFYGDGTNRLRLDPYVPGTLNSTLGMLEGYTAPEFVESGGYLVLKGSDSVLTPFPIRPFGTGWWTGVPITVTAKWGYSETPGDVKLAIIEWVINIWRETDPAGLKLVNLEGAVLRETMPPRVREVVKLYRMKTAKVMFV